MQVRLALYLLTIAFCASDRASEIRLLLLAALAGPLAACSASPLAVHPAFRCAFHCHARKVGFPGTQSSGSRARLSPLQRGHSAISPVSPRSLPRVSLLLVSLLTCLFSLNFQNNFLGVYAVLLWSYGTGFLSRSGGQWRVTTHLGLHLSVVRFPVCLQWPCFHCFHSYITRSWAVTTAAEAASSFGGTFSSLRPSAP